MITLMDLSRWRTAKDKAVTSLNIESDIAVAMQEMLIELKQMRKDNLQLLDAETVIELFAEFAREVRSRHDLDGDLEDQLAMINMWLINHNYDLEI